MPSDFAYVFIVFNSKKYRDPYLVVQRYSKVCRNPDTLADMLVSAYNTVLSDKGVEINIEPWNVIDTPFWYVEDGWESWNLELYNSQGRNLIRKGYEDALEMAKKEVEEETPKAPTNYKSINVRDHIVKDKEVKAKIVELLHLLIDGLKTAKDIARPVRWLCDHDVFHDGRLPYNAFINEFPQLGSSISVSRYNHLISSNNDEYRDDDKYYSLNSIFEFVL